MGFGSGISAGSTTPVSTGAGSSATGAAVGVAALLQALKASNPIIHKKTSFLVMKGSLKLLLVGLAVQASLLIKRLIKNPLPDGQGMGESLRMRR